MKKNLKRWLALLLAITMIVTSGAFTNLTYLRATDSETPEAAASAETQQETKTEEKEKEKKQEVKVEAKDDKTAEEAKKAEEEAKAKAEEQKKAEEAAKAEEQKKAEEAAKADEQKKAEEAAKADEQKTEESATTEEAQKSNEDTNTEETVTPAETAQEGQKAEESAKEENKEQTPEQSQVEETAPEESKTEEAEVKTYEVKIEKPSVDGGSVKIWSDGDKTDASNGGTQTVKEGETFYLQIATKEGYSVEQVTDQDGKTIDAKDIKDNTYSYELNDVKENKTLNISYKEEKQDEVTYPAFNHKDSKDGVTANISAPEGVFPEGTTVELKALSADDRAAIAAAAGCEASDVLGLDITFKYEGKEIQPTGDVKVSSADEIKDADEASVYHVNDGGSVDKIGGSKDGASVGFTADSFSPYGVVLQSNNNDVSTTALSGGNTVKVGEYLTLTGTTHNCTNYYYWKHYEGWSSSNTAYATVYNGVVRGIAAGTVTITHTYCTSTKNEEKHQQTESIVVTVTPKILASGINLTGADTVKAYDQIKLTPEFTPTGASAVLSWQSSNTSVLTVDENGMVTGVAEGEATVIVRAQGADGKTISAEKSITVTAATVSTDDAQFYFLKSPTKDPDSNASDQWGENLGSGKVTTANATWSNDKNITSNVAGRVIAWPSGYENGIVPKTSSAWQTIFNSYKEELQKNLSYELKEEDVLSIVLIPHKISRNNGTTPDKHVDCRVRVITKGVHTALYLVQDPGQTDYSQKEAQTKKDGETTAPTGEYPLQKVVNGVTYTFSGWYTNENLTGTEVTFETPYVLNADVTFYAKYTAGHYVRYNLNGGSWSNSGTSSSYFTNEGTMVYVVNDVPTREGYTFLGWKSSESTEGNTLLNKDSAPFSMPDHDVTLTAQWEAQPAKYKVEHYTISNGIETLYAEETKDALTDQEVSASERTIDGYRLDTTYEKTVATGKVKADSSLTLRLYYVKRTDLSYTVNYLEANTNKVLQAPKTTGNQTFEDVITSRNEVIDIDGYEFSRADKETLTITTGENVINLYYVKRADLSYTVNYLEKDTNEVIQTPKTTGNQTFEDEILSSDEIIPIDGYDFVEADKDKLMIGTGENVINLYYSKQTNLSYTVRYLEVGTEKVLHDEKTVENQTFKDVVTEEAVDINGYNLQSENPQTLTIGTGTNVITFYYTKKNDLGYVVNYLEKDTNKVLHEAKTVGNKQFEDVITSAEEVIEINGYNYDSVDKVTLTIGTGDNFINIYYTKKNDLSYTVNYLEKDTNAVLREAKTVGGKTFEDEITSNSEVVAINGYNYDSADKAVLKIGTGENVINLYYTKRTDLSYTVNYLEKGTNKVLHEAKTVGSKTFGDIITSSDEVIRIDGYNYDSVDKEKLTIGTEANIINIYYVKRADLSYTVNYLEANTNKVLQAPKTTGNQTFEDVITSRNEVIDIDGYEFSRADKETLTITTGENVINLYYVKRADLSYTVNYLEANTNKVLQAPKTTGNQTFEDVITSSNEVIDIDGYEFSRADKETLTITTGENVINLYYVKRTDLSYTVNYLEKDTNEVIQTPKTTGNQTFEDEILSSDEIIPIDGYNFVEADKDKLTIGTGENVINLYYSKQTNLSYTVRYLEVGTEKVLHDEKTVENQTFKDVVTEEAVDINGYNLQSENPQTLTIGTGTNVITFYYTKKNDLGYVVNYLEKDTNKVLHEAKTVGNKQFEDVITSAEEVIEINGYNYDSVDKVTLTIGTGDNFINIYYTKKNDLSYTVNYLEKDTNAVLREAKTVGGKTFEDEITSNSEVVAINGYNYDSADKAVLKIGTGENVINLYYTKRTDLSYTVNYLEKGTNKVLHEAKTVGSKTFGDIITSSDEVIRIDGYNYDSVDKEKLTIGTEANIINIYYVKRADLSYTVNYLEANTNKVLQAPKTTGNQTFEDVITSSNEVIDIDGYEFSRADKETLTITTGENVINLYYVKRADLSYTVNYLEKDTDEVIQAPKTTDGQIFEDEILSSDEIIPIDGYNFVEADKDKLTITTGENVINLYYSKKTDLSYTVRYLEVGTEKVLYAEKTVENQTFKDVVTEEAVDINGYNLQSANSQTLTIGTGTNVITFYYTKKNDLGYVVNYLEKDTNKVLHEAKTVGNKQFEDVITSAEEVIEINGYNYDSVDKDTLIIGTGDNFINIYYTKKNDLSYTVNYLEKDTNAVLREAKTVGGKTFEDEITSNSEVVAINGYNYDSADKAVLKIGTGENVINLYYTKRTDLSYTVNYLEKGTNKVLHEANTVGSKTFGDIITSSDEVIRIDGYNYDSVDKEKLTIGTEANIINIYYVKRADLSYTVNYLEANTNKVLQAPKTTGNKTFEDVITSSNEVIDIDGYEFSRADKETLTITTGENVINLYYVKRADLSYTVNYLEKDTDEVIQAPKTTDGQIFEDEILSSDEIIPIDGYNFVEADKDKLTITTGENVINLYYSKKTDLSYTVRYLEVGTEKVLYAEKTVENQTFKDVVTEEAVDINGYNLQSANSQTLTIGTGTNVITFYYTKKNDLGYVVNYLEKDTNKVLHEAKTVGNKQFEDVITSAEEVIEINGYNYDSVDKDTLIIGTGDNFINIYYTKKNDLSYTVNYLEKDTNAVLREAKTVGGKTFEDEITSNSEVVAINGYNYDSADKAVLKIGTGENVINLYYTKRTDLSYTVNYLEKDTGKVLHEAKVQNNVTFASKINSVDEKIEIAGYTYDSADKDVLEIGISSNILNLYYTANPNTEYRVEYYYQNKINGKYERRQSRPERIDHGTTDTSVYVKAEDLDPQDTAYVFDRANELNVLEERIAGDGSTKLKVYFALQYNVTGEIDHGSVTNAAQKVEWNGKSAAMDFTVAEGYIISEITINGEKQTVGSEQKSYTYPAMEGIKQDTHVVVKTVPLNPSITVYKKVTSTPANGSSYALGETITYQLVAENTGNQTLHNVVVTDPLTKGRWTIASMTPGQKSEAMTTSYVVTEADILNKSVKNVATATSDEKPGVTPGEENVPTEQQKPSLFIEKVADKVSNIQAGDVITYTITVTNNGNVTINDIEVKDNLTGDTFNKNVFNLIGSISLAPGEHREFTVRYTATQNDIVNGSILNVATVTGTDPDGNPVNDETERTVTTERANADYTVTKTVDNPQAEYKVGDVINYTIRVTNTGNLTLNNLTVTDQMQGASGNAVIANKAGVTVNGNTATVATLAVGASIELKASYTVARADADGTLANRVNVTSTTKPGEDPENPNGPTTPSKSGETDPTPTEKTYVLTIHYVDNNGNAVAPDYTARLLAGETIDAVVSPAIDGYTPNFGTIVLPATGMPAANITVTVIYTPDGPDEVLDDPENPNRPNNGGNNGGGNAVNNNNNNANNANNADNGNNAANNNAGQADANPAPADGVIQPDDNGGYDLTPVEDTPTPLANMNLDDHACCILHFLIMLLTLIIFALYTKSRKNRQLKVEELREQLAIASIQKELDLSDEDMAKYLEEAKKLAEEKKQANA